MLAPGPKARSPLPPLLAMAAAVLAAVIPAAQAREGNERPDRDRIQRMVVAEALDLGVDPALALAVAHAESYFDPRAESHKGARGVMQIMPATARGEYALHPDILWDARVNIRMGLHFLRRLLGRYDGREDLALSYFNGGSRVGTLPNARVIPATRSYVEKVLRLRKTYRDRVGRPDSLASAPRSRAAGAGS